MGALGRTARSLAAKCQTNLVLSVRSATFPNGETERQRSVAVGKWPCSRLLLMSLAGRSLAAILLVLGDRRSLAPYCGVLPVRSIAGYCRSWPICGASRPLESLFFGRARRFLTVSPVCGRRNEAIALRRCLRIAAAKWSGCKAGESVIVCGRNRADAWRVGSGSALAPGRDQAQVAAR
jgi:hypothetical protein